MKLLDESRKPVSLQIRLQDDDTLKCGIPAAILTAVSRPDGNSRVELRFKIGSKYKKEHDGPIKPLVLIGTDVYGLRDKPFEESFPGWSSVNPDPCDYFARECIYHFTASTDSLRSAQTFLVRDIAWKGFDRRAKINFAPSFNKLANVGDDKPASNPLRFFVTGSDLNSLCGLSAYPNGTPSEIEIRFSSENPAATCANSGPKRGELKILSDNTALLTLAEPPKGDTLKLNARVENGLAQLAVVTWDLDLPQEKTSAITSNPSILHKGDSQTVTFSGADFSKVTSLQFENITLKPDKADDSSIKFVIPSVITSRTGIKQFVAQTTDIKGKPKQILLKIEVVSR